LGGFREEEDMAESTLSGVLMVRCQPFSTFSIRLEAEIPNALQIRKTESKVGDLLFRSRSEMKVGWRPALAARSS